jgi:hypothetical protein
MSSLPTPSADTLENSTRSPSWKIKLLYDGECATFNLSKAEYRYPNLEKVRHHPER